jgi:hypothetical protein
MSAFMVEDKTINRVVNYLRYDNDSGHWTKTRLEREAGIILNGKTTEADKLARAMFDLNVRAVEDRYGEGEAKTFRALDFKPDYAGGSRMQVLKSLRCWLYQCTEGDVPETPLYQIMDDYSNRLAYAIVSSLPEFEAAEWG